MELPQTHIRNLRVVQDKNHLIEIMPRHAIVAEIGVDRGLFSREIVVTTHPQRLHLIDSWAPSRTGQPGRYGPASMDIVLADFSADIASGGVYLNRGFSWDVLEEFQDEYFDWVYLDTSHKYDETARELAVCRLKMKPGGMILGHDYTVGNFECSVRYGVIEAVNEFCVRHDWELLYLTNESHRHLSYALRKTV